MKRPLILLIVVVAAVTLFVGAGAFSSNPSRCFGPETMDLNKPECRAKRHQLTIDINIDQAANIRQGGLRNAELCIGGLYADGQLQELCDLGDSRGRLRAAIIGDSHSGHWRPAFDIIGKKRGWKITSILWSGCDYTAPGFRHLPSLRRQKICDQWRLEVPKFLARHPEISTVALASLARRRPGDLRRHLEALNRLPQSIKTIIVVRDTPLARAGIKQCVKTAIAEGRAVGLYCSRSRKQALPTNYMINAAEKVQNRRVIITDLSNYFCDRSRCYPALGGTWIYADESHVRAPFIRALAPYLDQQLKIVR